MIVKAGGETSAGEEFGKKKLAEVLKAIDDEVVE